jgi:Subtilase family/Calx-beta domain
MDSNINPLPDLTNDELSNVENTSSVIPLAQQNLYNLFALTDGPLAKLSSDLATLFTRIDPSSSLVNGVTGGLVANDSSLQIIDGNVAIEATADSDPAQLLSDLQALGIQQPSAFGRVISGVIPISKLGNIAALSSLRLVRPAYKPITNVDLVNSSADGLVTNVGSVTNQGDTAQRSDIARSVYGVNGAGITIGVLSDSYNSLRDAADDVASGDLPSGVIVLKDLPIGGSDEGRAMLQIVYDVAPGATLAFNTAVIGGQAGFANGILNLAKPVANGGAGASVIVDDIGYFAEPFFQDGIVTQAVDQVASTGVAYFSAAGNGARQSYESVFRPSTVATVGGQAYTFQDFDPSGAVNIFQAVTLNNGEFTPVLQWDQPFASASIGGAGSQSDLDLFLFSSPDLASGIISSSTNNNLNADPFEFFDVTGTGTAYLAIGKRNTVGGPDPSIIKYVDFGFNTTYQFATNSSTSYGHNQSANGQGVGAAYYQQTPAFGVTPPVAESFTSLGGTPILFDTAGNRLTTPVIRNQPAITAPDGVDTTFFGNDRDGNGKPNFSGTSAAAPSAAAAAALIRQAIPGVTNTQIYNALKNTALDMNTPGYDFLTGSGLIRVDAAIASLSNIAIIKTTDGAESGTVGSVFTLVRTNTAAALNVSYSLGGTATVGPDYTDSGAGIATFAAGAATTTITLATIDDAIVDPNETIIATITAPTGYSISGSGTATATIADNDSLATVISLALTPISVSEDGTTNLVYTFTRTGDTTNALTANYVLGGTATLNTDYSQTGGQIVRSIGTSNIGRITFAAGANTSNLIIDPTVDTTIESNETVAVRIVAGTGYDISTTTAIFGTIINDDLAVPSTVSIAKTTDGTETGTVSSLFTLTRTGELTAALNVSYSLGGTATFGSDYTDSGAGIATFAAGAATTTITLATIDDAVVDPNETIIATITAPTGYSINGSNTATATIADNDFLPTSVTLALDPISVTEDGTTNLVYTFTRTGDTTNSLTTNYAVGGTAIFNTDYTQTGATSFASTTGSITFAAGANTANLIIDPTADSIIESNESVAVRIVAGTGYSIGTTTAKTGTIINDDFSSVLTPSSLFGSDSFFQTAGLSNDLSLVV